MGKRDKRRRRKKKLARHEPEKETPKTVPVDKKTDKEAVEPKKTG